MISFKSHRFVLSTFDLFNCAERFAEIGLTKKKKPKQRSHGWMATKSGVFIFEAGGCDLLNGGHHRINDIKHFINKNKMSDD